MQPEKRIKIHEWSKPCYIKDLPYVLMALIGDFVVPANTNDNLHRSDLFTLSFLFKEYRLKYADTVEFFKFVYYVEKYAKEYFDVFVLANKIGLHVDYKSVPATLINYAVVNINDPKYLRNCDGHFSNGNGLPIVFIEETEDGDEEYLHFEQLEIDSVGQYEDDIRFYLSSRFRVPNGGKILFTDRGFPFIKGGNVKLCVRIEDNEREFLSIDSELTYHTFVDCINRLENKRVLKYSDEYPLSQKIKNRKMKTCKPKGKKTPHRLRAQN